MAQVESMEMAEQFDQLEKMAQDLRQTDARFIGSNSKLRSFYSALGAINPCACDKAFNESHSFDEKAAILNKWLTAKPTSMVVKIAMPDLYYYYAWQARGTGYANTVTPEAWQLFSERLKQAWTYIRDLDPKMEDGSCNL